MTQPIGRLGKPVAPPLTALGLVLPFILIGLSTATAQAEDRPRSPSLALQGRPAESASHPIPYRDGTERSVGWSGSNPAWWLGPAGVMLVVVAFGGLSLAKGRGLLPSSRRESSPIKVVGRVSLSTRHSVYLLQAGARTLIVGTGSQGPPTLLGELDDPEDPGSNKAGRDAPATEARS